MTKAERIFRRTRWDCKQHIERYGCEINPDGKPVGFCFVSTELAVSTRTLNDMMKLLSSRRRSDRLDLELGVISAEKYEMESSVLNMVESTITNTRKAIKRAEGD